MDSSFSKSFDLSIMLNYEMPLIRQENTNLQESAFKLILSSILTIVLVIVNPSSRLISSYVDIGDH